MLRFRVIPIVLLDGYSVVKTIQFSTRRNLGNPIVVCRVYNNRNVDELILLDIDASKVRRGIDLHTVEAVSSQCFMPLTVGGGLSSCEDITNVLKAGADKVVLNSILLEKPEFLKEAVGVFGSQCIVASFDIKKCPKGSYEIFSHSGSRVPFSFDEAIGFVTECKAGEVLVNSVERDGMMCGFDLELVGAIASKTNIPVIVAGGASSARDFSLAVKAGASAVSAASVFHFTSLTPRDCKEAMSCDSIPVRM